MEFAALKGAGEAVAGHHFSQSWPALVRPWRPKTLVLLLCTAQMVSGRGEKREVRMRKEALAWQQRQPPPPDGSASLAPPPRERGVQRTKRGEDSEGGPVSLITRCLHHPDQAPTATHPDVRSRHNPCT